MKKTIILVAACFAMALGAAAQKSTILKVSPSVGEEETKEVVLGIDNDGYIILFDGVTLDGWRGYGRDDVPKGWQVHDGCLIFTPGIDGGDIIFPHDFKDFDFEAEWKLEKAGNSGIFYLAQETVVTNPDGSKKLHSIVESCPEYQLLDNVNHPDAKLGKDGNRQSASLYDLVPAKPQNSNPWGQWNKVRIVCKNGKVTHYQNGKKVLTYNLWTPQWTEMLQNSKFSEKNWPEAFKALTTPHDGVFGFQDHGNRLWLRNIKVKPL